MDITNLFNKYAWESQALFASMRENHFTHYAGNSLVL